MKERVLPGITRLFLFCAVVCGAGTIAATSSESPYLYVRVPARLLSKELIKETGFIRDHRYDDTYAFGYLLGERARHLPQAVREVLLELDEETLRGELIDPKTLARLPSRVRQAPEGEYEDYHTYTTLTAELKEIASRFPHLVKLHSAGKSVEGRELWYMRISTESVTTPAKPKLLYISSMHGDEVTGKELMVYLIRDLVGKYSTDTRIRRLVDYADIYIMPSMNPDGTEKKSRFNAKYVDLNRDFPEMHESPFDPNRAPETLAIMELHRNNHFLVALNFHGGALCVNIPWDHKANPSNNLFGDDRLMQAMAKEYASLNRPMFGVTQGSFKNGVTYGYEWYQILGGMQDWTIWFTGSTHATVEVSDVKWPTPNNLPQFWKDNRDSLLTFLERGVEGVHLFVTDSNGNPLDVKVDVSTAKRALSYKGGYVHRPTVSGAQEVTLRADGYWPVTVSLNASRFEGAYHSVIMDKTKGSVLVNRPHHLGSHRR